MTSHIVSSYFTSSATRSILTRGYRSAPACLAEAGATGRDPTISQGHLASSNRQKESVQSEYARAGGAVRDEGNQHPYDSASPGGVHKSLRSDEEKGNPERIGFADQVGGQSAFADRLERGHGDGGRMGGKEEATAPGFFPAVKQALGLGTSEGEVKQNRGTGGGVTGAGTSMSQKDR